MAKLKLVSRLCHGSSGSTATRKGQSCGFSGRGHPHPPLDDGPGPKPQCRVGSAFRRRSSTLSVTAARFLGYVVAA